MGPQRLSFTQRLLTQHKYDDSISGQVSGHSWDNQVLHTRGRADDVVRQTFHFALAGLWLLGATSNLKRPSIPQSNATTISLATCDLPLCLQLVLVLVLLLVLRLRLLV
jgi:hypothetical protein